MSEVKAIDCLPQRQLVTAAPNDNVRMAAKLMAEHSCGSVVVMDGERLAGIFTESDLAGRVVGAERDPDTTMLADVMTREPAQVAAQETAADAIRQMHECGFQHLPVMDGGKVLGVLSWRDMPFDVLIRMQPELDERNRLSEHML